MPPRLPRKGPHVTFRVEVLDASATRVGHVVVLSVPATSLVAAVKHYVANRHSMLTKAVAESGAVRSHALPRGALSKVPWRRCSVR